MAIEEQLLEAYSKIKYKTINDFVAIYKKQLFVVDSKKRK